MRARLLGLVGAVAGALGCLAVVPGVALANDSASVSGGVPTIVGSANADQIHVEAGAHPQGSGYPAPFGVEAWETAPGQSITAEPGCTAGADGGHPVVYCGTDSQNRVVVSAGAGDDTVTMEASSWAGWEVPVAAVTLNGEDGNDTFHIFPDLANNGSITVDGGNGNDMVDSTGGNSYQCPQGYTSTITGDAGDDILAAQSGSRCASTIHGGDGNDQISGGQGSDQLFGDAGNDNITGGGGNDTIDGGPGQDTVSASDNPLYPGTMTFNAVDGEADTVTCGYGPDTANVDQYDTVPSASSPNACAKVNRTAGAAPSPPPNPTPPGPVPGPVPTITVARPAAIKLTALLNRGVRLNLTTTAPVAATVNLVIDAATARRLKLGKRTMILGHTTGIDRATSTFTVKPQAKFRRELAKARRFTLLVSVTVADAQNHQITKLYKIQVKP